MWGISGRDGPGLVIGRIGKIRDLIPADRWLIHDHLERCLDGVFKEYLGLDNRHTSTETCQVGSFN